MSISKRLRPSGGEIHAWIFENRATALPRGVFWTVGIDFEPFEHRGEVFHPRLTAEWLGFPSGDWRALDGWEWSSGSGAAEVERLEASFYTVEHDPVTSCRIKLRSSGGSAFTIEWEATVNYPGFAQGEAEPAMRIRASALGVFRGVMLDNSIVKPQARFREGAAAIFAEHLRLDRFGGGVQLRTGEFGVQAWWLLP